MKIIGIILCGDIGVWQLILLSHVFTRQIANIDEMDYKVRIHWLAKLIRFEFRWKEKAHAVLKILWFVIDFTDPEAVAARKSKERGKSPQKAVKAAEERSKKSGKNRRVRDRKRHSRNRQTVKHGHSRERHFENSRKKLAAGKISLRRRSAEDAKWKMIRKQKK